MTPQQRITNLEKELALLKSELQEDKFVYPVYKKYNKNYYKFTNINTSIKLPDGSSKYYSIPYTDPMWEEVKYFDEDRMLADKQLVWHWDNDMKARRAVGFYNAKNKCTFNYDGRRDGAYYNNYKPYEGEYPEWAIEAQKTLEG